MRSSLVVQLDSAGETTGIRRENASVNLHNLKATRGFRRVLETSLLTASAIKYWFRVNSWKIIAIQ